jgi:hypothetical protein
VLFRKPRQKKHLTVSDAQIAAAIQSIPAIAQLRTADGKFDEKAYVQLLAAQGMTPEQLDARMRFELPRSNWVAPSVRQLSCRSRCSIA